MSFLKRLFGKDAALAAPVEASTHGAATAPSAAERVWDEVYDARSKAFERAFGPLPADIQKLGNLVGVWPGGGLYVIPSPQLRPGSAIYASFGLTNPDMPSHVTISQAQSEHEDGRMVRSTSTLIRKEQMPPPRDWPGYGYEIIVAAEDSQEWPLWLLQWAVQAEILNDVGFRDRVEKYDGMTVESVQIADDAAVHLFIAKAQPPLMAHLNLPTGQADILVITVITQEEMDWSRKHGRAALLSTLMQSSVRQFSMPGRPSLVSVPDIGAPRTLSLASDGTARDYSDVSSREMALSLVQQGQLETILGFPAEFGGDDVQLNQYHVPPGVRALKDETTQELSEAVESGLIDKLNVQAQYKGDSFVPAKIIVEGTHSTGSGRFERTIEIW